MWVWVPLPNFSLKLNTTHPSLAAYDCHLPLFPPPPPSFSSWSLIITFAIFWWCECNSWRWVIWVWWGGCGSSCGVFWYCVLYYIWGFLCVVTNLKPTANLIEPVHETNGKWQSKTWGLSVGLSHRLTCNPSLTDPWTPFFVGFTIFGTNPCF